MTRLFKSESVWLGMTAVAVFGISGAKADPDYGRAYTLAAASYCAYAVSEVEPDRGQARAARCLAAAAASDKALAQTLGPAPEVEAYYDPKNPENAYLLARGKDGLILAFRGTLTPPIDPKGGVFHATAEAIGAFNQRARGLRSFIADWLNDAKAAPTPQGRHAGFDKAWQALASHLKQDCGAAPNDCSRFPEWLAKLDKSKGEQLYVTGHSKGGALATLAAIDMPQNFGVTPVTYTFSGAKALTAQKAAAVNVAPGSFWRFEAVEDIVPALPPDSSFGLWKNLGFSPYAHIGALVLFSNGGKPRIEEKGANSVFEPNDASRILAVLTGAARAPLDVLIKGITAGDPIALITSGLNLGEGGCRKFVDAHFEVFTAAQGMAPQARRSGRLFGERLRDEKGDILWGYHDWCALARIVK